jgi:putative hydrolase of the HAD superfamily
MNVVFDFGAVLFTWRPVELVAQYFPAQASTPAQAGHLAHAVFGHPDWHSFDRGTLDMDAVVQCTALRLGLDHAALSELVGCVGELLTPIPESVALLEQLHQQRSAVQDNAATRLYFLSNMPQPYARTLERNNGFLQWFDGGIFSSDVKCIKPDPSIYQLLQTRYHLEPAQTVFIDDLLTNVKAAREMGWHGIHFESAQQIQHQLQAMHCLPLA